MATILIPKAQITKATRQLPDRLDEVMHRLKSPTKADLAFKVGALSGGSYSRWFKRPPKGLPRYKFLYNFAARGVNLNFLVFGEQPVMRNDALPMEASIARVREAVINHIREHRNLSKTHEASIASGEHFIEFIAEAIRKNLLSN
jgi:hypothetical protein